MDQQISTIFELCERLFDEFVKKLRLTNFTIVSASALASLRFCIDASHARFVQELSGTCSSACCRFEILRIFAVAIRYEVLGIRLKQDDFHLYSGRLSVMMGVLFVS